MDVVLWIVGALVLLIGLIVLIGMLLPGDHSVSRTRTFNTSPEELWLAVNDPAMAPRGSAKTETTESVPPRLLVNRVVGETAFAGSWTFEIAPDARGSALTITETASVFNPVFRFVSRFVIGHYRSIDAFMANLSQRFPG